METSLKLSKRMSKRVGKLLKVGLCIFVVLMLVSYALTGYVLYHPHFNQEAYAQLQELENLEELEIDTPVGSCAGWMYHSVYETDITIILFPGNMYTSEEMMGYSAGLDAASQGKGINLITLDYPGYGRSEGIPVESTIKAMALAAFDVIVSREDMQNQKIILMGYSLGTGVANYVASKREADGLILMAPYQNGYDIFNGFVDVFHGPMKLFIPYRMRADKFALEVGVKPLLMASKDDEMIPYESSLALSEKYPLGCHMKTYEGFGHNGFWQEQCVQDDIFRYIAEIV